MRGRLRAPSTALWGLVRGTAVLADFGSSFGSLRDRPGANRLGNAESGAGGGNRTRDHPLTSRVPSVLLRPTQSGSSVGGRSVSGRVRHRPGGVAHLAPCLAPWSPSKAGTSLA